MSRTGNQLLSGLSRFIGDDVFPQGLAPSGNGSTTTIVDTDLTGFGDDYFNGWYIRITVSGSDQYKVLRVTDFVGSTGTLTFTPAITSTTASTTYELHKVDPHAKFTALDEARFTVYPALYEDVWDDTVTADGISHVFDIPAALRRGPVAVYEEAPLATEYDWNFLASPNGDSLTGWTATNATASIVTRDDSDLVVPKYGDSATKVVVDNGVEGKHSQLIADMANGITAAGAKGRRLTFAKWAHCLTASRLTLQLVDDDGLATSAAHGGKGWELLTATLNPVYTDNATLLTAEFVVSNDSSEVVFWHERGWLYYGDAERVTENYQHIITHTPRRDDNVQQVALTHKPARGHQLRFKGKGPLSALGTTIATQATNTMEVDEFSAEILFAQATKILFRRLSMNLSNFPEVAQRIAINEGELRDLKKKWGQENSEPMRMVSVFR